MRFMCLYRTGRETEEFVPPSAELMAGLGKLTEEATKAGVLLGTEGLQPSAKGARVAISGGKISVTDGPFAEAKELVGSYALYEVRSKDEAIEWTKRFLNVVGEGEVEIRQVFDASDFGPGR